MPLAALKIPSLLFSSNVKCSISFQEITIRLLHNAMLSLPESKGFLVDGFPREISQGEQFEREVS